MARIPFPENFTAQQRLFTDVNTKHTADGANSELKPYLAQQSINLTADAAAATQAAMHEEARSARSKSAENFRQLRDNHFLPMFALFKSMVQFLKGFYRGNERELGHWGISVNGSRKIVYPSDFDAQTKGMDSFLQKHTGLGNASPLIPYLIKQSISVPAMQTNLASAVNHQKSMKEAAKSAEEERVARDHLWSPVVAHLRGIVDYLKKLNSNNPKSLGAYGISVDDSPRPPKLRKTTLKAGAQITQNGVRIGGSFNNIGSVPLHLYRGKTITGTPTVVAVGDQLGILKGWSTLTVVNISTKEAGRFTVTSTQNH